MHNHSRRRVVDTLAMAALAAVTVVTMVVAPVAAGTKPRPAGPTTQPGIPSRSDGPPAGFTSKPGTFVIDFDHGDDHGSGHTHDIDERIDREAIRDDVARQVDAMLAEMEQRGTGRGPDFGVGWSGAAGTGSMVGALPAATVSGAVTVTYNSSSPPPAVARPAIEDAVGYWNNALDTGGAPVVVEVSWQALGGSVLGYAGPTGLYASASLPTNYFYPVPLANVLTGSDLNGPSVPEIFVVLNSTLASDGRWHYGSDAPAGHKQDLRSVVAHEIGHGLGFASRANNGDPVGSESPHFETPVSIYDAQGVYQGAPVINAGNVAAALTSNNVNIGIGGGQTAPLYSPSGWQQGSSFTHFETATGALMVPVLVSGQTRRTIDPRTLGVMTRMGWLERNTNFPPPDPPPSFVRTMAVDHQVFRIYQAHFLRVPDQSGFDYWFGQRAGGASLLDVIAAFQSSQEFRNRYGAISNQQFVTLVYQNVLARNPDSGGLTYWTGQLDGGLTRAEMMREFAEGSEYISRTSTVAPHSPVEGEIRRLYLAYFLREADGNSLDYWVDQRNTGASLDSVSQSFASSTEFQNRYGSLDNDDFVRLVYRNVLDRDPDQGGFDFWLGQLNAGVSRGTMLAGFSESAEFIRKTGTIPNP